MSAASAQVLWRRMAIGATLALLCCSSALSGPAPADRGGPLKRQPSSAAAATSAAPWTALTPAQRRVLAPLQSDWASMEASNQEKWLQVANRFPSLTPAEQDRVRNRMAQWARMQPSDRGQARLRYQNAQQQLTPEERLQKWQEYQRLSREEQLRLSRSSREAAVAVRPGSAAAVNGKPAEAPRALASARRGTQVKTNIVPAPAAAQVRPVSPGTVRDGPGATTSLLSKRPAPPAHLQPGLPKIAATAPFVDPKTLLPRRGAQAAAVWSPPASTALRPE